MIEFCELEDIRDTARRLASLGMSIEDAIKAKISKPDTYFGALDIFTTLLIQHADNLEELLARESEFARKE